METENKDVVSLHLRAARAAAVLAYLGDRALAGTGLSIGDLELLEALTRRNHAPAISTLGRELGVERSVLSRQLSLLQTRGLLSLDRRNPSRTQVQLSDAGKSVHAALQARWSEEEARLRQVLGEALPRVIEALRLLTDPAFGAAERVSPFYGEFVGPPVQLSEETMRRLFGSSGQGGA